MNRRLRAALDEALNLPILLATMPARRREVRRLRDVGPIPDLLVATFHEARDGTPVLQSVLRGLKAGLYRAHPTGLDSTGFTLTADMGTIRDVSTLPLIHLGRTLHPRIGEEDADPVAIATAVLSSRTMDQMASERLVGVLDDLALIEAGAHPEEPHPQAGSFRITAATPWQAPMAGQSDDPPQRTEARQGAPTALPLTRTVPIVDPSSIGMPVCASANIWWWRGKAGSITIGPLHGTWSINPFARDDRPGLDPMETLRIIDEMRRRLEE